MKDFILSIMKQYTIESMLNGSSFEMADFGLDDDEDDEDDDITYLQSDGGVYALMAKKFMLCDIAEPNSAAGIVAKAIKENIEAGIKTGSFVDNDMMKHLLTLDDMNTLASHIAILTVHSIMKDVDDINNIPYTIMRKYLTPDAVAIPMGFYVATVCIGNSHFDADSFNVVFANAWHNYYRTAMVKLFMLKMNGNGWKKQFAGCLFDN